MSAEDKCRCGASIKACPCGCPSPMCAASGSYVWNCRLPSTVKRPQVVVRKPLGFLTLDGGA